ncbi:Uma2 family endonuclease [Pseudobutyrivibrio xylanivorans]|uniref:Helix-turn-helix domain-containing protein n=1 Tax=Pseudobutyrivibrio xylanivorans TaxID=185007 RepID=A0A5P6VUL7_PSEXY|nr:Uma2 family endonuclease [Pseudobutyrivibrio xylanivorans]QFJ54481.1 helix-turn-helix domain-containing protein [Pseudobutyrivibrio xylanivorans]
MEDNRNIKERKKQLKLTTAQVAQMAGLPVSTVSKIMTGETKNPSFLTIEKIDKALAHEEMLRRVYAYFKLLKEYIDSHPNDSVNQIEFEKLYKRNTILNQTSYELTDCSLAIDTQRINVEFIHELGEDKQIELLNGHLIYNEAPNPKHQIMVQSLGRIIDDFIHSNNGKCQMFNIGINLYFEEDEHTLLIPDVVVLCDDSKLNESGVTGAPDWIIEVVSKCTRHLDYNEKMHRYMVEGVREYWIIDPEKERVTTYIQGEPMMAYIYSFDDDIPVKIYDGKLSIIINSILG